MLGYFGPAGTFTHQALLTLGDVARDARPYATVPAALEAVRAGEVDAALVPIENSVEGGVSATLDALVDGERLMITREVLLPVQFGLYVRPGTQLADIRRIKTHPHAHAQCRDWVAATLPAAQVTEGGSTAAAAAEVADQASGFDAAICAAVAGELYGLEAAATGIADNEAAVTRFVLVAPQGRPTERTGADKTTLVTFMHADHSGALLEILQQFALRGVNLSRIESRPTKTTLGNYCFSIDAEGHLLDERMADALVGLHRVCRKVVFLGSYPRADKVATVVAAGASDADYDLAQAWLATLRATGRDE